jgi:hypothetical protein
MRGRLVVSCAALAIVCAVVQVLPSRSDAAESAAMRLVPSYLPPDGDPAGAFVRGRSWTYDSAITATARAAQGDLDGAGAILDQLQTLQAADGSLAQSYDIATGRGDGPPRSGVIAWVGLAAIEWRGITCSGRHDALIAGAARWLLARRIGDRDAAGHGLIAGGTDVTWVSAEHNFEARAFLAGLAATLEGRVADPGTGVPCPAGLDGLVPDAAARFAADLHAVVGDLDVAIERDLLVLEGATPAHVRQGLRDEASPIDAQALGILWLAGRGRLAAAERVAATADDTMLVRDRAVDWPSAAGATFTGYRPFADAWGADVLWMEGTLQMRLAKARIGGRTERLDDSIDRWTALTGPDMLLQADRAGGEDYHAWPAAAPAAWLGLNRSRFALLSA